MNPENFAMSPYQFVNSLASCYPQSQLGHGGNTNSNTSTTSAANNAATANNDYFSSSAYTPNLYPNTPQPHYNQAYSLTGQQNPNDMVDYTQLQPQPQRLMLPQQQQQASINPISCKYDPDGVKMQANNNNNNNNNSTTSMIASPQDLSSTGRDISPKLSPSVVESVARSLNKTMGSNSGANNQNNPLGLSSSNSVNHTNVPMPMGSPNGGSDTDSESGDEAGGSQNGSGKKGTPPQIYPWMKRVHLGTSEFLSISSIFIEVACAVPSWVRNSIFGFVFLT